MPTLPAVLRHLKHLQFKPGTVVDVGAYVGDWSRVAAPVFPQAQFILIDANADNAEALDRASREIGERARPFIALLGREDGATVDFYCSGTGSSVLRELTSFPEGSIVRLPMRTLDAVVARSVPTPVLLKLDVQGFELEVLRGGARLLEHTEVVVLETSLLPYNSGAPLFAQVVAFLDATGFVVFDFCGQLRRQTDSVLFQTDVVFVRRDSKLRAPRKFWNAEP